MIDNFNLKNLRVDLTDQKNGISKPRFYDPKKYKNNLDFYQKEIYYLRNEKTNLEMKFDQLKSYLGFNQSNTIFDHYSINLIDSLKNLMDSLSERIEAVEIFIIQAQSFNSVLSTNHSHLSNNIDPISTMKPIPINTFNYYDTNEAQQNTNRKINYINTTKLAQQVNNFLDEYSVSRTQLLKTVFNKDHTTSYLNSLISNPSPWDKMKDSGRARYIAIKRFFENKEKIENFLLTNKRENGYKLSEISTKTTTTTTIQTEESFQKSSDRLISEKLAKEYSLPLDMIDQLKFFLEKYNIPQDVFARVFLNLSQRQLRYLYEKLEALKTYENNPDKKSSGKFKNGLNESDKFNLWKISVWFESSEEERFNMLDSLKKQYYKNTIDETSGTSSLINDKEEEEESTSEDTSMAAEIETNKQNKSYYQDENYDDDDDDEAVENYQVEETPSLVDKQKKQKSTINYSSVKNIDLLILYYKANNYPNDEEYESIAKICGLDKEWIIDFYKERQKRFPFQVITSTQYRQLIDYYYSKSTRPTAIQTEQLARKLILNTNYIQKWFSKQRQCAMQLAAFIKNLKRNNIDNKTEAVSEESNRLTQTVSQVPTVLEPEPIESAPIMPAPVIPTPIESVPIVSAPIETRLIIPKLVEPASVHCTNEDKKNKLLLPQFGDLNETQLNELEEAYNEIGCPNEDNIETLADQLNLSMDQVWQWFKEKRKLEEALNKDNSDDDDDDDESTDSTDSDSDECLNQSTKIDDVEIEYEYDEI